VEKKIGVKEPFDIPVGHPISERPEWPIKSIWKEPKANEWRNLAEQWHEWAERLEGENEKLQKFDQVTMDRLILSRMHRRKKEMEQNKEHISDYSGYAILEELIKIFTNLEIDHQKELSEEPTDA